MRSGGAGEAGEPSNTPGGGVRTTLLGLLRPAVTVETEWGPVRLAPYGEPDGNYFPILAAGLVVATAMAAVGVVSLARRLL